MDLNILLWHCEGVLRSCCIMVWILFCGIVRMCCVLEDFLVLFSCLDWNVNVIMGVRASLTLVGREEKTRMKGISWACIVEDLGVWAPLYAISFIFCLGGDKGKMVKKGSK